MLAIVAHAADEEVSRSQSFAFCRAMQCSITHLAQSVVSSVRLMMSQSILQSLFQFHQQTHGAPTDNGSG